MQSSFTLRNCIEDISLGSEWLREQCSKNGLNARQSNTLDLVYEELVTNTIKYGYGDCNQHQIYVELSFDGTNAQMIIEDDGEEFNPLNLKKDKQLKKHDDIQIGGLGLFLVKTIMDSISYERREGKNHISLRIDLKRLEKSEE